MPDDSSNPTSRTRRDFGDLRGEALIAHLVEHGNGTALELLWRVGEATLAVRLAVPMAETDDPRLSDLMLHELLTPTMDPALVQAAIFEAVSGRWPRLSTEAVREVDAALRDIANAIPAVAARRGLFEAWLLEQSGPIADAYAAWAIQSPAALGPTVDASLARFKANPKLRAVAAAEYRSQLAAAADGTSWSRAANFVEASCVAEDKSNDIVGLVADLVSTSPTLASAGPFQPVLTQIIYKRGSPTLVGLLAGPELPVTPGIEALLALVETWPDEAERLRFFTLTLRKQTNLWPLLAPIVTAWPPERWSELLAAILAMPDEDVPDTLSPLFTLAPEGMSAALMEIAVRHPRANDPGLFGVVVAKALANFRRITKDNQEAVAADPNAPLVGRPVGALWWPKEGDETGLRLLTEVMASFGSAPEQVQILADTYQDELAAAPVVAAALPDQVVTQFVLEARARSPKVRGPFRVLAEAVRKHRPELFGSAAGSMQAQSFDIDVAAVMAPTNPGTAFAGSQEAYESLSEDQRDELLGLLEEHAGPGQVPVVGAFRLGHAKHRSRQASSRLRSLRPDRTGRRRARLHSRWIASSRQNG